MENINSRPIILVSNSSWYLYHYRKLLIKEIKKARNFILAIAPYDSTSKSLSKILVHIPWRMSRSQNQSIFSFLISFLRMLLLIRALKPKLIHSHTLQANLITSIVSSLFGINCVFSFAGIGRFSKSKGLSKFFLISIFRIIYFFNSFQREARFKYKLNMSRSVYIFQNQDDIDFIKKEIKNLEFSKIYLIPGSGVPNIYIAKSEKFKQKSNWLNLDNTKNKELIFNEITFVYCARLLKTKGILIFLELSKFYPKNKFLIFGSQDPSSKNSLNNEEVSYYQKNYKNINFINNKKDPLLNLKENLPILIVPSFYGEGFPRGVIEATTLSIPVIASKDTAKRIHIKDILYVSKKDCPKSYIKCINQIKLDFKNRYLSKKLELARKKSIKNFSEKLIVEKTLKVYDSFKEKENNSYLLSKDIKKQSNWIAE